MLFAAAGGGGSSCKKKPTPPPPAESIDDLVRLKQGVEDGQFVAPPITPSRRRSPKKSAGIWVLPEPKLSAHRASQRLPTDGTPELSRKNQCTHRPTSNQPALTSSNIMSIDFLAALDAALSPLTLADAPVDAQRVKEAVGAIACAGADGEEDAELRSVATEFAIVLLFHLAETRASTQPSSPPPNLDASTVCSATPDASPDAEVSDAFSPTVVPRFAAMPPPASTPLTSVQRSVRLPPPPHSARGVPSSARGLAPPNSARGLPPPNSARGLPQPNSARGLPPPNSAWGTALIAVDAPISAAPTLAAPTLAAPAKAAVPRLTVPRDASPRAATAPSDASALDASVRAAMVEPLKGLGGPRQRTDHQRWGGYVRVDEASGGGKVGGRGRGNRGKRSGAEEAVVEAEEEAVVTAESAAASAEACFEDLLGLDTINRRSRIAASRAVEAARRSKQSSGGGDDASVRRAAMPCSNACCTALVHLEQCVSAATRLLYAACASTFALFLGMRELVYYYAFGCVAYAHLEGWSPTDTIYFLTVTATTVGYGDLCPATRLGRIFTCAYMVLGLQIVLSALAPLLDFLHGGWRERLVDRFCMPGRRRSTRRMPPSLWRR